MKVCVGSKYYNEKLGKYLVVTELGQDEFKVDLMKGDVVEKKDIVLTIHQLRLALTIAYEEVTDDNN